MILYVRVSDDVYLAVIIESFMVAEEADDWGSQVARDHEIDPKAMSEPCHSPHNRTIQTNEGTDDKQRIKEPKMEEDGSSWVNILSKNTSNPRHKNVKFL